MLEPLGRVITAMVTPFNDQGDVDYDEAVRLANHLADTGTETVLIAGTTGESPTLTHDEEFTLFKRIKVGLNGKARVMAGTGSNSTRTAIEASQEAERCGVDSLLQVVPYYNKPSQEGVYRHFKAIADAVTIPILLYNIPGRTGTNMSPETIARLAEIPNIIGVKEAAGSVEQVGQISDRVPKDFLIYSGDDGLTLDFMEKGACGVVSVASHLVGQDMSEMIQAKLGGDDKKARAIESRLTPLFDVLFITSNPTPVKAALTMTGFKVGGPRLPLVEVTDAERQQIKAVLDALSLN